jgi:hypothetical protein
MLHVDELQKHHAKWEEARDKRSHITQLHLHEISRIDKRIETKCDWW